ncbi:MAG: AAA family ATPase [Actinobacteria bacterium]|nr:AAA family ATPase [Actinomycetota bacterium]
MHDAKGSDGGVPPASPARCPTGVPGLDDVTAGGLPARRLYLIRGSPGTGKTTLARNLASPLGRVCGADVRAIEFAAHEAMSGEHGRTQREVHRVLTEVIPELAGYDYTVLVVDEVESLAIHRGSVSLEANPVDVHRTTDAVLTALDLLADLTPNVVTVVTTNFTDLVDAALPDSAPIFDDGSLRVYVSPRTVPVAMPGALVRCELLVAWTDRPPAATWLRASIGDDHDELELGSRVEDEQGAGAGVGHVEAVEARLRDHVGGPDAGRHPRQAPAADMHVVPQ